MNISFGEILGELNLGRLTSDCARHALPLSMRYVNVSACFKDTMRASALANSFLSKNTKSFWKHVSVSRNKKVCTPTKVDDRVGDKEITDI